MPSSDYAPSTQDVAAMLRARTRDVNGNYVTTANDDGDQVPDFNEATTPTAIGASALIAEALDEDVDAIGADIPEDDWTAARRVVTLLAAANIEMSYFPEQAAANNSTYNMLMKRHDGRLSTFQEDMAEEGEETSEETMLAVQELPPATGWDGVMW